MRWKQTRRIIGLLSLGFLLAWGPALWAPAQPEGRLGPGDCQRCHPEVPGKQLPSSVHKGFYCTVCHEGARTLPHEDPLSPENCARCHPDAARVYFEGIHGKGLLQGIPDVPSCGDCHGGHDIAPKDDPNSPIFPFNIPKTCGRCHGNEQLAADHQIPVPEAYQQYLESVHGRGLLRSGLLVAATCVDCHGYHAIYPNDDPHSKLYRTNVAETCGKCHLGVLEEYRRSVHGRLPPDEAPTCIDCHRTHAIPPPYEKGFRLASVLACAGCHQESFETYRESYHGQVTALGYAGVATCADCHGNHLILPPDEPESTLSPQNIVATCRKCHPYANAKFVQFIPHVRPSDPGSAPPGLYAVWLFMTLLLLGVFSVFGAHTLLWIVRGYLVPAVASVFRRPRANSEPQTARGGDEAMERRREERAPEQSGEKPMPMTAVAEPEPEGTQEAFIRRFGPLEIGLHISVVVSFLGLALTGLILKYSEASWARVLAWLLGGVPAAAAFHRFFALITFGYFFTHLFVLAQRFWEGFRRGEIVITWEKVFGPNSMIPRWQDFRQFAEQFAWFLGLRKRPPQFDRWTYFEKFDYWAVFWGVAVIGLSGLILWFKNFFTQIFPGWILNVAFIVHSDEALLAVGFIFAVHFFNTHLRPESFPLDLVIFLGVMPEEEYRVKHPAEYERLVRSGKIDEVRVPPPPTWAKRLARAFGFTALGTGLVLLVLIVLTSLGILH